ncbi:MAG: S-formylglutathione hydrolase [Glaciecola sp.]|jgi:S-formylglutathione hydrolase
MEKLSSNKVFGGEHAQYSHYSSVNNCTMNFAVYMPPIAMGEGKEAKRVPVIYWLSGLTCNEQNFMQKAGALRAAAELGVAIIAPDTSPRGDDVPDDPDKAYDFGIGAGFYLNATQAPWSKHYNMYDYITKELQALVKETFWVNDKASISGHSMGGHGALAIGLKNPEMFTSISAFSPICNPVNAPWGKKAFSQYLGDDENSWLEYDACYLLEQSKQQTPILIDQGTDDNFLAEQLMPDNLIKMAQKSDYQLSLNMRSGYDHSYFFIASFIDEHLSFHAQHLFGEEQK